MPRPSACATTAWVAIHARYERPGVPGVNSGHAVGKTYLGGSSVTGPGQERPRGVVVGCAGIGVLATAEGVGDTAAVRTSVRRPSSGCVQKVQGDLTLTASIRRRDLHVWGLATMSRHLL